MRTFIAIELPEEIKDYLAKIQDKLQGSGADVKWVAAKNIHLTLKFLGEIEAQKLGEIEQSLEKISLNQNRFYISLSEIGAFPNTKFPRVIWVGINKGSQGVKTLAEELEEKFEKIGIPKEDRPFSSHITLGRVRSGRNREGLRLSLDNLRKETGKAVQEFLVTKITLFKSTLTPKGPIYEALKETNLRTA